MSASVATHARGWDRLLRIDCLAACVAGVMILALSPWLARLYAVPWSWVAVGGIVNLLYATYSGTLLRRATRPPALILALIGANAAWAVLCFVLAVGLAGRASAFGIAHLIAEGTFVGGLAALEWRYRAALI